MMPFYDQVMRIVLEEKENFGSFRALSRAVGLNVSTVTKWFKHEEGEKPTSPNLLDICKIVDIHGVHISRWGIPVPLNPEVKEVVENQRLQKQVREMEIEIIKLKTENDLLREFLNLGARSKNN